MADNFSFDITAGADLEGCLRIAFQQHSTATHWAEAPRTVQRPDPRPDLIIPRLVLLWTDPKDPSFSPVHPFPSPVTAKGMEPIVVEWLKAQNYGKEPDHDGDNHKGWRIYNESWGHVVGRWQAFCAIEPEWMMYGK